MKPLVIAHRGYSSKFKDNTLTAIVEAFTAGADMCEIDLHMTNDRNIFVFHDYYINGRRIAEQTLGELKRLCPECPQFEDILELIKDSKRFLFEIKDRRLMDVVSDKLKEIDRNLFIVGSFDGVFLKDFKQANPDIRTCLLLGSVMDASTTLDFCKRVGAEFVLPAWEARHPYPDMLIDTNWIELLMNRGVNVISWHEERREVLERLINMPLYGICTNDPPLVRGMIGEGSDSSS